MELVSGVELYMSPQIVELQKIIALAIFKQKEPSWTMF